MSRQFDKSKRKSVVRKFSGAVIPVGSKTGKVLLSSKDSAKIIKAVRQASTGKVTRVELSDKEVAERIPAVAS